MKTVHRNIFVLTKAERTVLALPLHSNEKSTPPSVFSLITCWIGISKLFGIRNSVKPNCLAALNLFGLVSTPIIWLAPALRHPIATARPMAFKPKTAQVLPRSTLMNYKKNNGL